MKSQTRNAYINIFLTVLTLVSLIGSFRIEKDLITGLSEVVFFIMAMQWIAQFLYWLLNDKFNKSKKH